MLIQKALEILGTEAMPRMTLCCQVQQSCMR